MIEREGREELIPGDTVVLATGAKPAISLYEKIRDRVNEIHVIGDAKSPRKALEAVAEGFAVGRTI
jgi:2,4-dienoyl-CoA reductase (NADPH2)